MNANLRLIRFPEVEKLTGLARSSIYKKISDEDFPKPIKLGERCTAFVETEISQWIEQKITESRTDCGVL